MRRCDRCEAPLEADSSPRRRYCTDACRAAASYAARTRREPGASPQASEAGRNGAATANARRAERAAAGVAPTPSDTMHGDYTADQWEFIRGVEAERKRLRKRHLTWAEVLHVALKLGYRKATHEGGVNG